MAKISTYAIDDIPTLNDKVIGTETDNSLITKNYKLSDIIALVPGGKLSVQSLNTLTGELTLVGAGGISISSTGTTITLTGSGSSGITSIAADNDVDPPGATGPAIILKGTNGITVTRAVDSNVLSIIGTVPAIASLTTNGTTGASTLINNVLNIPNYDTSGGSGGITSVDGATGPAIDLVGKGGISVSTVGNIINIDGTGISGNAKWTFGAQVNGTQFLSIPNDRLISIPQTKARVFNNGVDFVGGASAEQIKFQTGSYFVNFMFNVIDTKGSDVKRGVYVAPYLNDIQYRETEFITVDDKGTTWNIGFPIIITSDDSILIFKSVSNVDSIRIAAPLAPPISDITTVGSTSCSVFKLG